MARAGGSGDGHTAREIVRALRVEPTYVLIFALFGFGVAGSALRGFAFGDNAALGAGTIAGACAVTLVGIVLVERRRRLAVATESPAQRDRLSAVPARESAVRGLFGDLVKNDCSTCFVYSSTLVKELYDHAGKPLELHDDERHVTTIYDVKGIARIHSLLDLGGKSKNLHVRTAANFELDMWACNLILVGSRNANPITHDALERYGCPVHFSDDAQSIVAGKRRWPEDAEERRRFDFALVAKLVERRDDGDRVCLAVAGIGAEGTLRGCEYLYDNVVRIHDRFEGDPFACVLRVERGRAHMGVHEEDCRRLTPR